MAKKLTNQFIAQYPELLEIRLYQRSHTIKEIGSSHFFIKCPFCNRQVIAFIWSISIKGKRCDCGAFFNARGNAYKRLDDGQ